ncbi:hypothetical protein QQF64_030293 [Cirrhinus molitorella]|uniref:Uncharacterized protein n=1 Tax=Cirrhinus molitorella TaxID=172907 RepID=A0ABR3N2V4_9TELE
MPAVCQRKRRENRKAEVTTVSLLVGVGVLRSACRKSACQGPLFPLLKHKLSFATEENSSADFGLLKEGLTSHELQATTEAVEQMAWSLRAVGLVSVERGGRQCTAQKSSCKSVHTNASSWRERERERERERKEEFLLNPNPIIYTSGGSRRNNRKPREGEEMGRTGTTDDSDVRHRLCVERSEANANDTVREGRTPQPVTLTHSIT